MKMAEIKENWDLVVIGGGITGAGVLREAARNGLRVLLVEGNDFAWGTSSRSSKLVHGGLRYLKEGRFLLTRESVRERERLLKEAPGLVTPLDFMLPIFNNRGPSRWVMEAGLMLYDLIAGKFRHRFYNRKKFMGMEPLVTGEGLQGGFIFLDAQVDDARLVLRLIGESIESGGVALNYTRATEILRDDKGNVTGVLLRDVETGETKTVHSSAVVNATGSWAETLHKSPVKGLHLRPLKGSHIIIEKERIPVQRPMSFFHPKDGRPLFVIPWEGAVLLGTTDLDYESGLNEEPTISADEASYMLEGLRSVFPGVSVEKRHCISSFSGIRPVLSEGKLDPSKESREHVVWVDKGLVTVTGGKMTTFRALAWDTLKAAGKYMRCEPLKGRDLPVFTPFKTTLSGTASLSADDLKRLYGRYGKKAEEIVSGAAPEDLQVIPGTHTLWAELAYVAENEQIRHLADLLLRRVRIGLLLPEGGKGHMSRIKDLLSPVLSWDEAKWAEEIDGYLNHWNAVHSVP